MKKSTDLNIMPIVKWSGSKRLQAKEIIRHFPNFQVYYEPFLGGGAVLGALSPKKIGRAHV